MPYVAHMCSLDCMVPQLYCFIVVACALRNKCGILVNTVLVRQNVVTKIDHMSYYLGNAERHRKRVQSLTRRMLILNQMLD